MFLFLHFPFRNYTIPSNKLGSGWPVFWALIVRICDVENRECRIFRNVVYLWNRTSLVRASSVLPPRPCSKSRTRRHFEESFVLQNTYVNCCLTLAMAEVPGTHGKIMLCPSFSSVHVWWRMWLSHDDGFTSSKSGIKQAEEASDTLPQKRLASFIINLVELHIAPTFREFDRCLAAILGERSFT